MLERQDHGCGWDNVNLLPLGSGWQNPNLGNPVNVQICIAYPLVALQGLEAEKLKTIQELNLQQTEAKKLSEEKKDLSKARESLTRTLQEIEAQTHALLEEKSAAERK